MARANRKIWVGRNEFYGYVRLDKRTERRKSKPSNAIELTVDTETAQRWRNIRDDFEDMMTEIEQILLAKGKVSE